MSNNTNPYNWKSSQALKSAIETFHRLSEALTGKVEALVKRTGAAEVDAGLLTKDIMAHQGAWKMVKDALVRFKQEERDKGGVGENGIDFGQAKEEVLSRIARLVARGAGRGVS